MELWSIMEIWNESMEHNENISIREFIVVVFIVFISILQSLSKEDAILRLCSDIQSDARPF